MRKLIIAAGLLLVFGGLANGNTTTLSQSGYWTAFGGTSEDGTPVCGIITRGTQAAFSVKWFKGTDYLTLHVFKTSWSIPKGMQIDIAVRFDNTVSWQAKAIGMGNTKAGGGIEFTILNSNIDKFITEMRYANTMTVSFPTGTETPWIDSLTGSNATITKMVQCMQAQIGAPTQPYGQVPQIPSQPYTAPNPPATPAQDLGHQI